MPEPKKKKKARSRAPKSSERAEIKGGSVDASGGSVEAEAVEDSQVPVAGELVVPEMDVSKPESVAEQDQSEWAGEPSNGRGVAQLFHNRELMDQVIAEMVACRVTDGLAEEMAGKLGDALVSSPEFKRRLIGAVMSAETSRGKMVKALSKKLRED